MSPSLEVAEQQRALIGAESVGLAQRVRAHTQLADELAVVELVVGVSLVAPEDGAAERLLEVLDGLHGDGVDHLLVEGRVALGGRPPVLREQAAVVQIDGRERLVGGVPGACRRLHRATASTRDRPGPKCTVLAPRLTDLVDEAVRARREAQGVA